ncbi:MAG TPA: LacI family DNA-binding transcriptional regulator [Candidatus Dormibacteraeota bacterium]|nr:LacI family DNA-binding transcriptional regulator [Candidatus Dormibacteraeota bacterium]
MAERDGARPRVTLKQVSELAGVSQSTVSRILNRRHSAVPIAAATRERVLRVIEELDYRPHPLARGLRGGGTALLGLIVREVADPFFAAAIEAIADESRRHGYSLVLGHARSSAREALVLAEVLETRHCDGAILLGDLRDEPRLWAELEGSELAVVAVCQGGRAPGIPTVDCDNRVGTVMALQHLHGLGHRRIAFLDAGWLGDVEERRLAYHAFMAERGLPVLEGYHQRLPGNHPDAGLSAFRALLELSSPPSAVFCATDQVALGVLAAAARAGLRVPADVSVVGFDDIPMARFAVPGLTTVRQPLRRMARLAVERLLGLIRSGAAPRSGPARRERLRPSLVVRGSTAAPGGGAGGAASRG